MPKKPKPMWEGDIACAYCEKHNHVKISKKIITPAEPAETEIEVEVEKSNQVTLDA